VAFSILKPGIEGSLNKPELRLEWSYYWACFRARSWHGKGQFWNFS